jgi:hypothetical protein
MVTSLDCLPNRPRRSILVCLARALATSAPMTCAVLMRHSELPLTYQVFLLPSILRCVTWTGARLHYDQATVKTVATQPNNEHG